MLSFKNQNLIVVLPLKKCEQNKSNGKFENYIYMYCKTAKIIYLGVITEKMLRNTAIIYYNT